MVPDPDIDCRKPKGYKGMALTSQRTIRDYCLFNSEGVVLRFPDMGLNRIQSGLSLGVAQHARSCPPERRACNESESAIGRKVPCNGNERSEAKHVSIVKTWSPAYAGFQRAMLRHLATRRPRC